jgi:hypothetical protein
MTATRAAAQWCRGWPAGGSNRRRRPFLSRPQEAGEAGSDGRPNAARGTIKQESAIAKDRPDGVPDWEQFTAYIGVCQDAEAVSRRFSRSIDIDFPVSDPLLRVNPV